MPLPGGKSSPDPRSIAAQKRLESLGTFLRQDPDNEALRVDLFEAALAAGAFQEAGAQVAQFLKKDPSNLDWRHREGLLLLARGEYAQARHVFQDLVGIEPADLAFRFNLAYAQFGMGSLKEAESTVSPLLEETSEVAKAAWALWLRSQHHLRRINEGLDAFSAALSRRLMGAEAWGVASLMALDAERFQDAQDWANQAIRANPEQMEALVTQGSLALGKQDVPGALTAFERALEHNPGDGRCWSGSAFARMMRGDLRGAVTAFRRALEAMPNHIGTWIGLGWCEFLGGNLQGGRDAFEQALSLDRNFAESHGGLAVILARQGQEVEARREIEIALKLDPLSLSARYAEALLSGETDDPDAFLGMARRVLAKLPSKGGLPGQTLADLVFRRQ